MSKTKGVRDHKGSVFYEAGGVAKGMNTSSCWSASRNRGVIATTGTLHRSISSRSSRATFGLRDASERNDGEMFPTAEMLHAQFDDCSWPSSNERMRRGAGRPTWPSIPRLEPWPSTRREGTEVHLIGCASAESRVRPLGVVPGGVVVELLSESNPGQRYDRKRPRAFVLHRSNERAMVEVYSSSSVYQLSGSILLVDYKTVEVDRCNHGSYLHPDSGCTMVELHAHCDSRGCR